jgi:hypothetical protein
MTNRYGVDVAYFTKELAALSKSLENRTPDELHRYLLRLADVAKPVEKNCKLEKPKKKDNDIHKLVIEGRGSCVEVQYILCQKRFFSPSRLWNCCGSSQKFWASTIKRKVTCKKCLRLLNQMSRKKKS